MTWWRREDTNSDGKLMILLMTMMTMAGIIIDYCMMAWKGIIDDSV